MDWQSRLDLLPGIIIGLTVHEFSHALMAFILGDDTAKKEGRITFNPFKHIDTVGLFCLIFIGFGWAKPVRFDPAKLKNFQRDRALIAFAGPFSNLLLGILLVNIYNGTIQIPASVLNIFPREFLLNAIYINFVLFVFNMLPIPPLDGSHILFSWLDFKPVTETVFSVIGMLVLMTYIIVLHITNVSIIPIDKIIYTITKTILDFFM